MTAICTHLRATDYDVQSVALETAQALVGRFHYAKGGANTATYRHGLFLRGDFMDCACLGVAWWIPPTRSAAEATYPANWQGVLSLSRFVLAPDLPTNAASFLLGRSMRLIDRRRWPCLVTYADTRMGHVGTIYKATNWQYIGLTAPEAMYEDAEGRQVARKAGGRTRTHAEMLELGYKRVANSRKHKYVHVVAQKRPA